MPAPRWDRPRLAATIAFATNGAITATLLARYAEVKGALGLSPGAFGVLVTAFMVGAACALGAPGRLVRRFGTARVTSVGTVCMAAAMVLGASGVGAGSAAVFAAGLALAGFADANVDVAQNAQGLRVQEAHRRSLLSSMHAGWSIGAAAGGLIGTLAASAGIPLVAHLACWGGLCALVMLLASRSFLPDRASDLTADEGALRRGGPAVDAPTTDAPGAGAEPTGSASVSASSATRASASARLRRMALLLAPLALVALTGIAVEDVGSNWSAVFLHEVRGVPRAAAGIGLSVLLVVQFVGRMLGDRVIDAVGRRAAVIASLALVVCGLLGFAWAPWTLAAILCLAVAGLGCAITVPLAFSAADALPGLPPHAGVTWINSLMRITTLALPPTIGALTTVSSLPLAITAVAGIAVVALALQLWGATLDRRRAAEAPRADA